MPRLTKTLSPTSWLRYIVDHPGRIIVLVVLITLLFAYQLPRLRFETSIYDLTIENLPATVQYEAFKAAFGSEEIILVVAKAENFLEPKTFERLTRLSETLSGVEGVKRAIGLPEIKKRMDITEAWDLSDFEKIITPIKLFDRNLVSQDRKTTVVTLILEDVEAKDEIIKAVKEIIDNETGLSLYQIGMPVVSKALASFTEKDFKRLPAITFALIAVILFLFFRNIRGILIPVGSVIIALVWTFGLMAWTKTPLSMLTMIVPIFLIAVGTAYCMYIFPEYFAAIKVTDSPREASYQCFLQLGFPTSLAVITTTIGLGSLFVNRITAIREFAAFSCFGILSMLFIMLTFLPAVMALLPFLKRRSEHRSAKPGFFDRVLSGVVQLNLHHQKITLLLAAAITLAGLVGISRIRVETNPVGFFRTDSEVYGHFHDIYKDLAGSFPLNVVIEAGEDDYFENPAHLKELAEIQKFLNTLDGIDKTISFLDYLKLVNYASNKYQTENYALPEEGFEVRMLVNGYKTMLGQDMLDRFMNETFSKANIMLRTHISSSSQFLSAKEKIETFFRERGPEKLSYQVTGFGMVISQSSQLITEGQVKSLSLTMILVFGIMLLLFMAFKVGLIAIVPNCFPIIVNFGLMGWLGIPLSLATSLIASIAIGLAVDDTIHYLVNYNREFKKDLQKERALKDAVRRVGRPIIFTTLTVGLGFSILLVSNFKPTAVFGLMMIVTMFSALAADLIVLPSLMLHVELITVWDLLRLRLGKDPEKGIPLFEGLSRTQVHYILMAGALRRFDTGDVVMRKGEISDSMYAVISGKLDVVDTPSDAAMEAPPGHGRHIATLHIGDIVGEMGMIRKCERSATVIAVSPAELLQVNESMIRRLQWLYPPTAHRFFFNLMGQLCNKLQNATECYLAASITDGLTGLSTRDHFLGVLEKEIARSRRYHLPLAIFAVELDHFHEVSDLFGHYRGDVLLVEAGQFLSQKVRTFDTLCRYDESRFVGILPQTDEEVARDMCIRLKAFLAEHCFEMDANRVCLTASFGLAMFDPDSDMTSHELVSGALDAATHAKKDGGESRGGPLK